MSTDHPEDDKLDDKQSAQGAQRAQGGERSRRTFFKAAACVPCAVGAYLLYDELTEYDGPPRTVGAKAVPHANPIKHESTDAEYCFFAVGDTGLASERRQAVIQQMQTQQESRKPDSIVLVGDNFYDSGVQSIDDRHWQMHFERPFSAARFPMPFYACLGNHDYRGNVGAQLEYSRTHPRWNMPATYYSFVQRIDDQCDVHFIVLDTTPIDEGGYSTDSQVRWLENELKRSTSQYKIVIGHHPLYTGGEHGRSQRNFKHLSRLFDQFQIDLYICGHDHDLQLHDTGKGWLHLVSGAGSKLRSVNWVQTTLFAQAASGFAKVTLNADRLAVEMFSTEKLLYVHQQERKQAIKESA